MKDSLYNLALGLTNLSLKYVPFFILRKLILNFIGISIGKNTTIHRSLRLFSRGRLKIGTNCTINRGVYIDNRMNVTIHDNVTIAHDSRIYTLGHDIDSSDFRIRGKEVRIESNVVLFAGSKIMPGVTISEGGVVLPYSLVTKNISKNEVWGGNPAKFIRFRNCNLKNYNSSYPKWLGN